MTLSPRLRSLAIVWIAVAGVGWLVDLSRQTRDHLTNGALRPFGDDFINYWSGAWLAWHHRAATIYDWNGFHAFEQSVAGAAIDFYHYSYPPVLLVLTSAAGGHPLRAGAVRLADRRLARLLCGVASRRPPCAAARVGDARRFHQYGWRTERHLDGSFAGRRIGAA